jgi:copper chaperone CopZ
MKKVEGVESVQVSLNRGEALLRLKPGNSVTVERIRQVVLDNGFTPKDSDVEIVGKVVERSGKAALAVSGPDVVYLLVDHRQAAGTVQKLWKEAREKEVVVRGHLPETATGRRAEEPRVLEVRDFAQAG